MYPKINLEFFEQLKGSLFQLQKPAFSRKTFRGWKMDSEVVQRLQKQLLDLRAENCDVKEKNKFIESKLKSIQSEKDEFEKELKLLNRKNKGTLGLKYTFMFASLTAFTKIFQKYTSLNLSHSPSLSFLPHSI